jgi:hypothetical protein
MAKLKSGGLRDGYADIATAKAFKPTLPRCIPAAG